MIRRNIVNAAVTAILLFPVAAQAAAPAARSSQELDEVLVNGVRVKPDRDAVKILGWLRRLVGQFSYLGYVDVRADGVPRQRQGVHGVGKCIAFGKAPGVNCTVSVVWPEVHGPDGEDILGGVSMLNPAMLQFGLDADRLGIRYMQVDSRGIADRGNGYLWGDTLMTTTHCVGIPGECQRITRITPQPDGQFVEMQTDIEMDGRRVVRYLFVMQRQGSVDTPDGESAQ